METAHDPLPYVITIKRVLDEDAPPVVTEHKVVAYSLLEAVFQATFESGAKGLEDGKLVVESCGPDVPAYDQWARARFQSKSRTT